MNFFHLLRDTAFIFLYYFLTVFVQKGLKEKVNDVCYDDIKPEIIAFSATWGHGK